MQRQHLFRWMILLMLALGVFWGLGEILARSFDLVDRLNGFPRRLYLATDDDELPYRLRPGLDEFARGVPVRVNSHGLRGAEIEIPRPAATRRVLALGDSVTFGYRMAEEKIFPTLLTQRLRERSGDDWEVLNAGVEGYNTRSELALLREVGFALDPETVVLAVNLNDYDHTPVLGAMGVLTLERDQRVSRWSLSNLSEFYLLLKWLVRTRGQVWVGETPAAPDDETTATTFDKLDLYISILRKRYWAAPDDKRMEEMRAALHAMRSETHARGIRLLVVILPDGDQIGVDKPDLAPQQRLRTICAEEKLECLDLHDAFQAEANHPLFLDIMHPNARGHGLIAEAIAQRLTP
ncbi:MAG: GDSL-type esterase/lipase family protein [Deltaproteobacteria bacterium]